LKYVTQFFFGEKIIQLIFFSKATLWYKDLKHSDLQIFSVF